MKVSSFVIEDFFATENPKHISDHIQGIQTRIRAAASAECSDLLLLTAAIHEERDTLRARELAASLGEARPVDAAVAISTAFGEIWKLADHRDSGSYIQRHEHYLRAIVFFELLHKSAATANMRAVATAAAFGREFQQWEHMLRGGWQRCFVLDAWSPHHLAWAS